MKTLKLILVFMILTDVSFGQYKSIFGVTSTQWNVILNGVCDGTVTTQISIIGDSIFNSHDYKEVNRYSEFSYDTGFLREDSLSEKVWFYDKSDSSEYLTMDLSLAKGDSFKIYSMFLEPKFIYVDSTFIRNGIKHIQFKDSYIHICAPNDEKFEFIEGTGTNAGLFYHYSWNGNSLGSYLLCQEKDGLKIYGNELFQDSCSIQQVDVTRVFQEDEISVYPNPTKNFITIKFQNQANDHFELIVYNSLSQITHSMSTNNNEINFSLNKYSTNVNYFILKTDHKIYKTGIILKL